MLRISPMQMQRISGALEGPAVQACPTKYDEVRLDTSDVISDTKEEIVILYRQDKVKYLESGCLTPHAGNRPAVWIEVKVQERTYKIVTLHAPFQQNDGAAIANCYHVLKESQQQDADIIMGDFNTYGSSTGSIGLRSSPRNESDYWKLLPDTGPTSSGGSDLDKIYVSKNRFPEEIPPKHGATRTNIPLSSDSNTINIVAWNTQKNSELRTENIKKNSTTE